MISRPQLPLTAAIALALAASSHALTEAERAFDEDLPRIIVTADPLGDRTADEIIRPVSVLVNEELDRRRAGTLGEVLDGMPGVANSDFGPGVGRPVVRGLQGTRVQVLEDGLGTSDVSGEGADHAIALDPSRADQIEVFRGPATLLYGSGAAGGVVNIRTWRFSPVLPEAPRIDGAFSYGFNGKDRQGRLALEGPVGQDFVFRADYSLRRTDDFDIKGFQQVGQTAGNEDTLRNSDVETDSGSITGLWRGDWGHFGLGLSYWETEYGIPENFDARPRDIGGQSDDLERVFADYIRLDLRGEFIDPLPGISMGRRKMAWPDFDQEEGEFEF
ncbi:MAG: TonB-dependent receptor plug domain-containing protein, partial [Wenzhouxiangella sp.]|nr:TonB-dependent receptor plug domain-containing protein [Wenzhouxiangella sp.]